MKKKKKAVKAMNVMTLSFFANRFGLLKSQLSWGVVVSENEDAQITITAAVLIKDKSLFIDILNDRLTPFMNIGGCKMTSYVAVFNRVRTGYKFTAGDEEKCIGKEQIESVYRSKFFSEKLEEEAKRLQ